VSEESENRFRQMSPTGPRSNHSNFQAYCGVEVQSAESAPPLPQADPQLAPMPRPYSFFRTISCGTCRSSDRSASCRLSLPFSLQINQ
jgi:hypothetical protein